MAKRKSAPSTGIIVVLLIVAALLVVKPNLFGISSGFTELSLSEISIVSNDPSLNNKDAWLLTVSQNGGGRYAVGERTLTASDGTTSAEPIKIETTMIKQECKYDIQSTSLRAYSLNKEPWCKDAPFMSGCVDSCLAKNNAVVYTSFQNADYWPGNQNAYCLTVKDSGWVGSVTAKEITFESEINATVGSDTKTGTVSPQKKSTWLGDVARVYWAGNLGSGTLCPDLDDQGYNTVFTDSWSFANAGSVTALSQNTVDNLITCINAEQQMGNKEHIDFCVDQWNSRAQAVLNGPSSVSTSLGTASISNGQAVIDLSTPIEYPTLSMHIDADWLAIGMDVGMPEIQQVTSYGYQTGETSALLVSVKNIETSGSGTFTAEITCQGSAGTTRTGVVNNVQIDAGQTQSIHIPITGSCTQDTTDTCTVTVYDYNKPTNKDTETVSVDCKTIMTCTPGEYQCLGKQPQHCDSNGHWQDYGAICQDDCLLVNGVPSCTDEGGGGGTIGDCGPLGFLKTPYPACAWNMDLLYILGAVVGVLLLALFIPKKRGGGQVQGLDLGDIGEVKI